MSSPFLGMDPYLEAAGIWRGFHQYLAVEIAKELNRHITPKYFADVEVHTLMEEIGIGMQQHMYPDVAVTEIEAPQALSPQALSPQTSPSQTSAATIEAPIVRPVDLPEQTKLRSVQIFERATEQLVTSIEILSPANKSGEGLEKYRQKRSRILSSGVHLVEIDLLRRGTRPGIELETDPIDTDYILLVNRFNSGYIRNSEIWPIAIDQPLPDMSVPLLSPDPDAVVDFTTLVKTIYQDARYDLRIDYSERVPAPALRSAMQTWWQTQQP